MAMSIMTTGVNTQRAVQRILLLSFICNVHAFNYRLKISLEAGALIVILVQVSFPLWLDYHNLLLLWAKGRLIQE